MSACWHSPKRPRRDLELRLLQGVLKLKSTKAEHRHVLGLIKCTQLQVVKHVAAVTDEKEASVIGCCVSLC